MPPGGTGQPMAVTSKATRKARAVRLGILSDDEVRRMSVAAIDSEQLLDRHQQPQAGGIEDPRLGTTDRDAPCGTCGCSYIECPGHFGHIELAQPVYHAGYLTNVLKVLRCICCECGALRLRDPKAREDIRRRPSARTRFRRVHEACQKIKECIHEDGTDGRPAVGCGHLQPTYRKTGLGISRTSAPASDGNSGPGGADGAADRKRMLSAAEARAIMSKVSDEDLKLMGMDPEQSRPEWMIIKALAVAPPPVRPSVQAGDGVRGVDDLTYAYRMVVRTNNELRRYIDGGHAGPAADAVLKNLQLLVATLMDNNIQDQPRQKRTCGKPIKDIRSRLKGKEGRVRGNLMGKRVDFSARTVITPDPILQLDQLGVPEAIAMNLTIPEHVTPANMEVMKQLVANGPTTWPGAKYIVRHDGRQIDLANKRARADAHLDPGYIVERQLRDGDYVVFNRQPSLHKMSLMGHRVKVLPFSTFRLNLSVTSPYNADFDGDEMNMHVPQSYETKAEVKEIMAVPKQVVAPKNNCPVMGIVQDSLLGIMLFTTRDTFVELDQAMNLLMWIDFDGTLPPPAILKPRPLWTGKQILSLVIPEINYCKRSSGFEDWACPGDKSVLVKNGELLCGVMTKSTVGATGGGLVHISWRDRGPEACRDFLSNTQNVVNNWLIHHGFTVGVHDIMAGSATTSTIRRALGKYKRKVQRIVQRTQRGQLPTLPGKGMQESFEAEVNLTLRAALERAGRLAHRDLESSNRLKMMVTAGSKGSLLNISQIMACVGQQNVEGKRIPFGFNRRSLPHFSKDDFGPESKGFVTSCYVSGLTPQEFYFHAMGGREGLIDTAVKTAETGYIQRRLIKALEDVQVKYDATVRTSRDQVIQFLYGEDGMAAEYIEDVSIPLIKMDNKTMTERFQFFTPGTDIAERRARLRESVADDVVDSIGDFEGLCRDLEGEYSQLEEDREALRRQIFRSGDDSLHLPVNVPRLLWTSKEMFGVKPRAQTDLSPDYVVESTRRLLEEGIRVYQAPRLAESRLFVDANRDATWLFKIYLRSLLCTKHVIQRERLTKESFDWLLGAIQSRFERSLAHPGEMAGSIGAQSMGEPATQMTLNTFHLAGVATRNVTLGVPRLKEVINVAKTIKTPSIRIFLQRAYSQDEAAAHEIGNAIEHTTLSHVVASSAIYYDPDPRETIIQADEELLAFHNRTDLAEADASRLSPWLLRFELDGGKMIGRDLRIEQIDDVLHRRLADDQVNIVRHRDLEDLTKLVFRLRLPDIWADEDDEETVPMLLKRAEDTLLHTLTLKGFPEITKVAYSKEAPQSKEPRWDPVTGAHSVSSENWIIETDGVALKKVLAVGKVDHTRTTSNDVIEILTVLGVEAARLSLIHELRFVLGSYGIYVNYRHLATLCDIMTTRGILTAITRHGINRVDSGALRKCSFEETVEILLEAAFHAEVDPLSGVTENIILGQLAPYGTGSFDVMMDTDMLKEANDNEGAAGYVYAASPGVQQSDVIGPGGIYCSSPFLLSPVAEGGGGESAWVAAPVGGTPGYGPRFTPVAAREWMGGGATPLAEPATTPVGGPATGLYQRAGLAQPAPGASPIYDPHGSNGAATPAPSGGQSGYSPTGGYQPYRGGAAASPGYQPQLAGGSPARTPGYYGAPQGSAAAYNLQTAGGRTPGYQAGGQSGRSPAYRAPTMGQSPGYTPGNPAYSPTQHHYGLPDPAHPPGGAPGQGGQPER